MKSVVVSLLDKNGDVQYGLNWGQRENRDPNQAYLQLSPDIYKSDFFPVKGKYFIVTTDDNKTLIFNRAQKDYGCALQTPENNSIIGEYIRRRLGVESGIEITKEHILKYGKSEITFTKKDDMHYHLNFSNISISNDNLTAPADLSPYLRAMRTKPFLLLAGISGTGKSRIVKQMAFDCCPDNSNLRKDATTPGNYCLVEVKPNWHDSSELIGYTSQIGGSHYVVTPFVRFLAKAMLYEEQRVPFFVCLDEMNLAPVEQYFAEFLSVLESRKVVNGRITSEALIPAETFIDFDIILAADLFGVKKESASYPGVSASMSAIKLSTEQSDVFDRLKKEGLRIPSNLIVIGTVNMDETTHQFSRKVIDRAMTIEMNLPEGEPFMDFFNNARDLEYTDAPLSKKLFLPTIVKAADAIKALESDNAEKTEWLKKEVATILTNLNIALEDTPFKIAYRVQNELMLYFYELWKEDIEANWNDILNTSVDQILMMKVLPRIEGDEDLLEKPLESLANFCAPYPKATAKVTEMKNRLEGAHFTSYWP